MGKTDCKIFTIIVLPYFLLKELLRDEIHYDYNQNYYKEMGCITLIIRV